MTQRPIADVLAAHTPELMRMPGVTGTYQGARPDGSPVIRILVERATRELAERLPKSLEGWPVEIEVSGPIRALDDTSR